jgi:hypothetical protein
MTLLNRAARDTLKRSPTTDAIQLVKDIGGNNPGAISAAVAVMKALLFGVVLGCAIVKIP